MKLRSTSLLLMLSITALANCTAASSDSNARSTATTATSGRSGSGSGGGSGASVSTPEGVIASASGTTITISWNNVEDATGYKIFFGTSADITTDSTSVEVEIADDDVITYDHTGLTRLQTYYYAVLATGEDEDSDLSEVVNATAEPLKLYVRTNGNDANPGTDPAAPKLTLTSAITAGDATGETTSIYVAEGTYASHITMKSKVSLYGGYSATDWNTRNTTTHETIIVDARTSDTSVDIDSPQATVTISGTDGSATLDGFTIKAVLPGSLANVAYSAVVLVKDAAGYTLSNNEIVSRTATMQAAGIVLYDADNTSIVSNSIEGVISTNAIAAAIFSQSGSANLLIDGNNTGPSAALNNSDIAGALICNSACGGIIRNNYFVGGTNVLSATGIGIMIANVGPLEIHNNIFRGSAVGQTLDASFGAAVISYQGAISFYNNTVYSGAAATSAAALYTVYGAGVDPLHIANNIFEGYPGASTMKTCVIESNAGGPTSLNNNAFSNCGSYAYHDDDTGGDLAPSTMGTGNVIANVTFTNLAAEDYSLNITSTSADIYQGGLNGVAEGWGFSTDMTGATRTTSTSANPANASAAGWSMGALER
jgi:hypothetical protein